MGNITNLALPYNFNIEDQLTYSVYNWFWHKSNIPPTNISTVYLRSNNIKIDEFIESDKFTLIQLNNLYHGNSKDTQDIKKIYTNITQDIIITIRSVDSISPKTKIKNFYVNIFYLFKNNGYIEDIKNKLFITTKKKREVNIKLISSNSHGYYLTDNTNIKKKDIDLKLFYDDKLYETNKVVINELKKNKSGLYIFNGLNGTGKTNYIKYLASSIKNKNVVITPSHIIGQLASPQLSSFLLTNLKDSVIILEDAENLVINKNGNRSEGLSNILNMADGILGDMLNIQFIITFNTPRENIDSALLRNGRLIAEHEFGKLDKDKATQISKNIGKNVVYTEDVILADVFNQKTTNIENDTKKIGFF